MPEAVTRITNLVSKDDLSTHFVEDAQGNITLNSLDVNKTIADKLSQGPAAPGKADFVRVSVDVG